MFAAPSKVPQSWGASEGIRLKGVVITREKIDLGRRCHCRRCTKTTIPITEITTPALPMMPLQWRGRSFLCDDIFVFVFVVVTLETRGAV